MNKFLNFLWLKITLEPTMFMGVIKQTLNVLVIFSLVAWDAQQLAAINILVQLLLDLVTRQTVTPNPRVDTIKTEQAIKEEAQSKQIKN